MASPLPKRKFVWLCSLILLIAFGLRVYALGRADFWTDEAVSLQHSQQPDVPALVESLAHNEGMPPLYFLGLWMWQGLGSSEWVVRFLSVLFGLVSIALTARLGAGMLGREAGLFITGFISLSSIHVALSQWARPYALVLCVACGLMLIALKLGRLSTPRAWFFFWIVGSIALYTLYLLGVMLLGVGLYVVYTRRRLGLIRALGPVALVGLGIWMAFLPWLPVLLHQSTWASRALWWVHPPQLEVFLATLDEFFLGSVGRGWPPVVAVIVIIPSVIALLFLGIYQAWKTGRLAFVLLTTLFPLAIIWLVSYWRPLFHARHIVFALPGVMLLCVEGLFFLKPKLREAIVILLLGVGLVAQMTPLSDPGYRIPWSRIAEWMALHAQAGDMLVFAPPFQRPAFDLKYHGPPLDEYGIKNYENYIRQPDAVLDSQIPLAAIQRWAQGRSAFWLLEDKRWPATWGKWEYQGAIKAQFEGVRISLFERYRPADGQ